MNELKIGDTVKTSEGKIGKIYSVSNEINLFGEKVYQLVMKNKIERWMIGGLQLLKDSEESKKDDRR